MNILLTNYTIWHFTGSDINILQLCQGLKELGIHADVATFFYHDPIKKYFQEQDISVKNLIDDDLQTDAYDLYWTHHFHTLDHLIFQLEIKSAKVIYSSLGPLASLEAPPFYHNALNYILSNSEGNKRQLIEEGIEESKIYYFPNYAPKEYFSQYRIDFSNSLHKIAIISNHPPEELLDFSRIASNAGYHVDFVGFEGESVYVNPDILLKYDLIISIGKTAQYCFSLRIPIYCYDHFGGPGYITRENLGPSEKFNFSGRGINRKLSGKELFTDIIQGYSKALDDLNFLFDYCLDNFDLEKNLEKLLNKLATADPVNLDEIRDRYLLTKRHHNEFLRLLEIQRELQEQVVSKANYRIEIRLGQEELSEYQDQILSYALSKSWRMTRPFRKFSRFIRKSRND